MMNNDAYLYDTKAEENGSVAQLLSTARAMFPLSGTSDRWDTAALVWAFHTFTKDPGESYWELTSRTIASDFKLGNHNYAPSPGYALAGITSLQQAEFNYTLAGLSIPDQFRHNINVAAPLSYPGVWYRNVELCMDGNYEVTAGCYRGKDWGDVNLRLATFILPYWYRLNGNGSSGTKLMNMLETFYLVHKGDLRFPVRSSVGSVSSMNGTAVTMVNNLETHAQTSLKNYALEIYGNTVFRNSHFPKEPKVCEENIFKKKLWSGSFDWSCPSEPAPRGGTSLKLTSTTDVNGELYSPLIKVSPNTTYKISYDVNANLTLNGANVFGKIVPAEYTTYAKESHAVNDATRISAGFQYGINDNSKYWRNAISYTFSTDPRTEYVRLRAFLGGDGLAKGTVYYDNVKIMKNSDQVPIPF